MDRLRSGDELDRVLASILPFDLRTSSLRTYNNHFNHFARFCRAQDVEAVPTGVRSVARYIAWCFSSSSSPPAPTTMASRLSVIAKAHKDNGYPSPTHHPEIARLMRAYHNLVSSLLAQLPVWERRPQRQPLSFPHFLQILCLVANPQLSLPLLRSVAAVAVGFVTLARGRALWSLGKDDITGGTSEVVVRFRGGKHRPDTYMRRVVYRKNDNSPTSVLVLSAIELWKCRRPDFPRFFQLPGEEEQLADQSAMYVTTWVREAVAAAQINLPTHQMLSSHSLRKGGTTSAFLAGVNLALLRHLGDWRKDTDMLDTYVDAAAVSTGLEGPFWAATFPISTTGTSN